MAEDAAKTPPAMKTWRSFPEFYVNEFVRDIMYDPRWTMSTKDKMPIDMDILIYNHRISGLYDFPKGLMTLDTMLSECDRIGLNPPNHAYYLDARRVGYMVLDIEPKCPEDIKERFLHSKYVYGEISMSGKGVHLVFKCPIDILNKYPIAAKKMAIKEEHGWYEFLMNHYVTFTRRSLPPSDGTFDILPYFEQACAIQKDNAHVEDFDMDAEEPKDIPAKDTIMATLNRYKYRKTLADFNDDHSRYEFGLACFYHRQLATFIKNYNYRMKQLGEDVRDYTVKEIVWLIYELMVENLEWREKHDTFRSGMPLLLYRAYCVIAIKGKYPDESDRPDPKLSDAQVDAIVKSLRENPA